MFLFVSTIVVLPFLHTFADFDFYLNRVILVFLIGSWNDLWPALIPSSVKLLIFCSPKSQHSKTSVFSSGTPELKLTRCKWSRVRSKGMMHSSVNTLTISATAFSDFNILDGRRQLWISDAVVMPAFSFNLLLFLDCSARFRQHLRTELLFDEKFFMPPIKDSRDISRMCSAI